MIQKKKIAKLVGLNTGIAATNVILFSKGLVGLSFLSGNPLAIAVGATSIVMSLLAFSYGNYKIITAPTELQVYDSTTLIEQKDYVQALDEQLYKKIFEEDIEQAKGQLSRLKQKQKTLDVLLTQKFSPTEMSYARFQQVITDTSGLIFTNIKNVVNRLVIFDYNEYDALEKNKLRGLTQEVIASKRNMFNEHIGYIKQAIDKNENIFLKLDNLMLEVSKLDESTGNDLESISAIQDINELIEQTKLYKE